MRLDELAPLVEGRLDSSSGDAEVTGITHDSRSVCPGDLFVCLKGGRYDGHDFIPDALARGAAAICVQEGAPRGAKGPRLMVRDTRRALPALAAAIHGYPSRRLRLVGVTGTNGKTTTTRLIASILTATGLRTGVIGTLGAELAGESIPSEHTTPEADQLQGLLAEMARRGAEAVVMEVSSHALAQHRTQMCEFDGAVFTNLTQDHLDYHLTMEAYLEAKLALFRDYPRNTGKPFIASVNLDDPCGAEVKAATLGRAITYAVNAPADVSARRVQTLPNGLRFQAETPLGSIDVELPLGGAFQVYNALGAIGLAVGFGYRPDVIAEGLATVGPVPGRFESVPTGRGYHVVVDYAHSPDSLKNLLESARRLDPRRILLVFGCGGDRDRGKRPIMGRLAVEAAELVVVTSDNPRSEDPQEIIREIMEGARRGPGRVLVEPDRRSAIACALAEAQEGDLVLVAGKGHEDYQEIRGVKHPFDDRAVVRELLGAPG